MSLVGVSPHAISGTSGACMLLNYIVFAVVVVLYCVFCLASSTFVGLVVVSPHVLYGTSDASMLLYYIVFLLLLYCVFCLASSKFVSLVGVFPHVLPGTSDASMLLYYNVFFLYCIVYFVLLLASLRAQLAFSHMSTQLRNTKNITRTCLGVYFSLYEYLIVFLHFTLHQCLN